MQLNKQMQKLLVHVDINDKTKLTRINKKEVLRPYCPCGQ